MRNRFLYSLCLAVLLSVGFSSPLWAMLHRELHKGDQVAKELFGKIDKNTKEVGSHPFYKGIPSESTLSAPELKGRAQALSSKDPASKMIVESSGVRSQFKIAPQTDPLMTGAERVIGNSLEIIGGKGTKVTHVQHSGKDEVFNCEEAGDASLETCTKSLHLKVIKTKVKKEWHGNFYVSKCSVGEKDGHYIPCGGLRNAFFAALNALGWGSGFFGFKKPSSVNAEAALNITAAYKGCMNELAAQRPMPCFQCKMFLPPLPFKADKIHAVTLLKHPHNPKQLHMLVSHSHTYNSGRCEYWYQPLIKMNYEEEVIQVLPDEWISNCARLEERVDQGLCAYDSKNCTQGKQTRFIEGVPITRDCWEETYTYSCAYPAKNDCGPLRARGCAQISSHCKQKVGNTCVVYSQSYQCKGNATPGSTDSITGGETPFCLDGNCREQSWETNDEMMATLAQLRIMKEMQGHIKNGTIFKGEDKRCSKCIVSFKDCCGSGKGWGKNLRLTDCSPDERLLREKRNAGLCHYVGTYCAEKIPLVGCIKKKSTYCCFGSKLLKAFHVQGRPQLGLGWGSAQEPLCRGFTVEELQRIDFSKLDLREIYEDLMKNFKPSRMNDIGKKVGDRLGIIKKGLDPKKKQQSPQRNEA